MGKKVGTDLRDLIPAIVVLGFIIGMGGLVLELTIASIRDAAADPIATGVLGTLTGTCATALVPLYLRDSRTPPPDPPPPPERQIRIERTGDEESDRFNEDRGWLEFRRAGRWLLQCARP